MLVFTFISPYLKFFDYKTLTNMYFLQYDAKIH